MLVWGYADVIHLTTNTLTQVAHGVGTQSGNPTSGFPMSPLGDAESLPVFHEPHGNRFSGHVEGILTRSRGLQPLLASELCKESHGFPLSRASAMAAPVEIEHSLPQKYNESDILNNEWLSKKSSEFGVSPGLDLTCCKSVFGDTDQSFLRVEGAFCSNLFLGSSVQIGLANFVRI